MNRKYMPLIIGGVVALLLAGLLFFFILNVRGNYLTEQDELGQVQNQFMRLNNRKVFPSVSNVQAMEKQLDVYQDYYNGILKALKAGRQSTQAVTRDSFRATIENVLRQLGAGARAKNIVLPPNFAFGFQRYAEGTLPQDEEMTRLVDQLRTIHALCSILYEAGVAELTSVERTVFERDAQPVREEDVFGGHFLREREAEVKEEASTDLYRDPDGLYTREHYVLAYRAQDDANRKVLDRLAQGLPFTVVTKMEVVNSSKPAVVVPQVVEDRAAAPEPVATGGGWQSAGAANKLGAKEPPAILPRELRVVAGQELPNIRLEVDVYRLAETAVEEEGQP
ncbi:MAG: Amuc_1100 family pilus-like protein [Kiritimatiellia bacterium]|jgi:hypothetical protein|nr:hypothetical protein [Lentisphaerota bacterium]